MIYNAPIEKLILEVFHDYTDTLNVMVMLLDTITEIAEPIAAIMLIIWLKRHWKR